MSLFSSHFTFCPTGFQTVKVGLIEVHMGRDPDHPGKMLYPHYASLGTLRALGISTEKHWRSLEVFQRELRKVAKREFTAQLKALEADQT